LDYGDAVCVSRDGRGIYLLCRREFLRGGKRGRLDFRAWWNYIRSKLSFSVVVGLYVVEIVVHVGSIVERDSAAQDIAWGHVGDSEAILREVEYGRSDEIESGLEFGVK
jgi:hypothetical protein